MQTRRTAGPGCAGPGRAPFKSPLAIPLRPDEEERADDEADEERRTDDREVRGRILQHDVRVVARTGVEDAAHEVHGVAERRDPRWDLEVAGQELDRREHPGEEELRQEG